ncbi:hypothetical protein [Periweissella fabalis]|uniref:Uncharacterized protein n=1 Tax=Periweissella fabalis TaxID=1070421 RepID=A0A7X6N3V4_9LACO|nr:hypothetical protein [Periweissella fabalis]MCM0599116.1 hypothetical protein [Periweissella fabalis]NKZ23395.1 hypothetical protein [Periweissella fabalis]
MDKKVINNFAVNVRRELIDSIKLKLELLGINETGISDKLPQSTTEMEFYGIANYQITGMDIARRKSLVAKLNARANDENWQETLNDFIEEVAYTWFNRIIAIRFMEVNDYLPSKTRVLSSETGRNEPDILFSALELEEYLGSYSEEEIALLKVALDTELPETLDKAYRLLFLKQVNALNDNLVFYISLLIRVSRNFSKEPTCFMILN